MSRDFSIWEFETYHTLWDVCIIGAGINGLSAGISLLEKNPSLKIVILDRWFIPLGASTRNAGFACFGSPGEILDDIEHMGEQVALDLVRKRWEGLQILAKRLAGSKSAIETYGGNELFTSDEYEKIAASLPYLNKVIENVVGQKDIFKEIKIPDGIRGFDRAIYNPLEGQLHPGFMIEHLGQMFIRLGGKIHTGIEIEEIEEKPDHVNLHNRLSIPFQAKRIIVSVNAFAASLLPHLDVHGARNHVFVTSPITDLAWKGCFHFDRGYYYFRNVGNRILLGGARNKDPERENTTAFGENPVIVEELTRFLYDHLALRHRDTIEYQWSGIMAFGAEKLPIVQAVSPRIFVGLRCSGMGIALASLIGEELSDLMLQQRI